MQACGDAHLLNFGVFATPERHLVFDVNDFDEACLGPCTLDLVRFTASVLVAAETLRLFSVQSRGLARHFLDAYVAAHEATIAGLDLAFGWLQRNLDELTAANSRNIKDVDSRAQQGIQLAHNKANEADQHAIDAGNRANAAQQTATQATTRLTTVEQVVGNIDQYTPSTQTEIRFKPGQSVLSKAAKDALDEMATPLKSQRGYIVEVQGFSSGILACNQYLSC